MYAKGGIVMDLSLIYHKTENFKYYNAHPNGLTVKDCVVRAVCTAFDKDYLETRRDLNRAKVELGFDSYRGHDFLRAWLEKLGYETIKFKAYEGEREVLDERMLGAKVRKSDRKAIMDEFMELSRKPSLKESAEGYVAFVGK